MKRFLRITIRTLAFILFIWLLLSLWVQQDRTGPQWENKLEYPRGKALLLYNPDPLYNLDEQLAKAVSGGLLEAGWSCRVTTYQDFGDSATGEYDLLLILTNTYNWAPDWPTRRFIENARGLKGKAVVAITVGSGSTERSKRLLEEQLEESGAEVLNSRTFWLLRPNDESRLEEPNVDVAVELAHAWMRSVAEQLGAIPQ